MSAATCVALKQISRAKNEALATLASARSAREQWFTATGKNPTNLTQREIDTINRNFKNRLLSVKWDCEDLEELLSQNGQALKQAPSEEVKEAKIVIEECRREIELSTLELDDFESNKKNYTKHGIAPQPTTTTTTTQVFNPMAGLESDEPAAALATPTSPMTSIIPNPFHSNQQYEKLLKDDTCDDGSVCDAMKTTAVTTTTTTTTDELHFDKRQIEASATIFENALYEHYETEDYLTKGLNATRVFNNLTRPNTDADVYAAANENEMILEMLETEYYNPPPGMLAKTKYSTAIRRLFDTDRSRYWSVFVFIFSLPVLLMLLLVI